MHDEYAHVSFDHWLFMWKYSGIPMAIVDPEGFIKDANQDVATELGYATTELIGKHVNDITAPEDVGPNIDEFARVKAGEIPYMQQDKNYKTKRGQRKPANLKTGPIRDPETKQILHFISRIWFYEDEHADNDQLRRQIDALETRFNNVLELVVGKENRTIINTGDNANTAGENITTGGNAGNKWFFSAIVTVFVFLAWTVAYVVYVTNNNPNMNAPEQPTPAGPTTNPESETP